MFEDILAKMQKEYDMFVSMLEPHGVRPDATMIAEAIMIGCAQIAAAIEGEVNDK